MGKRVWIILGVIMLIVLVVSIYLYNFHVFKTVRVCLGDQVDTGTTCTEIQDCIDLAVQQNSAIDLNSAPKLIRENYQKIVDESISCDQTCFVRSVRGINPGTQALENLRSCENGEIEVAMEIRGKDGIEILKWAKSQ